ncbi:geranylgeranylglyceryl/heptaprenylglyceryl phosphate synthase [Acidiluteibacter ferrifornacis]|uniref:Geranylgeranylglyceryl phosphate synthase n=1 Tax=Acidiluteibacter ferrifornacis TaxID=2692424 RepID=A0A6N9NJA5_9FLAO|nr:geranylgeranylglyceryl/heptaprenylglyceryl phosphate synthase [Acidiluteibacter ferrifornacis]MBR9831905.1 geranylgeranylglyceryl/heptaprenylglyceryl phosphate synthase [bacterium]NBG65280.1 geranylgeranylglyceryl/heptaprenylglyceryl phosphate synthase [Acidiluteibacter ferrifornacis]
MNQGEVYHTIIHKTTKKKKQLAVLIDPDKSTSKSLLKLIQLSNEMEVDYFFVGGSLMTGGDLDKTIGFIKNNSVIPVILFPGHHSQINPKADALLLLSLVSSRNPDMLIGQHVTAAPYLKQSNLEILSTAYLLIDGGKITTASYISNSMPIPSDKSEIAASTAMAAEMLGMRLTYLDAGSGANSPVPTEMIQAVKSNTNTPLIIGGGLTTTKKAVDALKAGADIVVVGNALEKNPNLLSDIASGISKLNQ